MCHTSNTNHTWILKKKTKRPSVKFLILLLFQKFHVIIGFFYTMQYNSPNENVKTHLKEVIYNAYYFKNGKKKKNAKILCFWVTNEPILSRLKGETKDNICYTENEVIDSKDFLFNNTFVEFSTLLKSAYRWRELVFTIIFISKLTIVSLLSLRWFCVHSNI